MVTAKRFRVRFVPVNDRGNVVGQYHHRAKLSEIDIDLIFALRETGMSYKAISEHMLHIPGGIAKETVRDICLGKIRGQMALRFERRMVYEADD